MHTFIRQLFALVLVGMVFTLPAQPHAERAARAVADFTVFLDTPTGFVFVKLPAGWKFVGKVDIADLTHLQPNVVTSLLDDDDGDMNHPTSHQKR